jgi:serine/threonine protein kinase
MRCFRSTASRGPTLAELEQIVKVCDEFEERWRGGDRPRIEASIAQHPSLPRPALLSRLLALELELARTDGRARTADEYRARFPEDIAVVDAVFAESPPDGDGPTESLPVLPNHAPRRSAECTDVAQPAKIGRYTVLSLLDEGGQARVFRVVHPELGKVLVLKLAAWSISDDPAQRGLIKGEGQVLAELDHANLVRVYDLDVQEDGRPFLVMEHVHGRSLEGWWQEEHPSPRQAAQIVAGLARAVSYVHGRGIVHQDIKPKNVLIDEKGAPRLIDFGLARLKHAWCDVAVASVGGTFSYLSPEQATGDPDQIGPWTDVFGLGGVLYYLLTGRPVYQGPSAFAALQQASMGEQVAPRTVNPRVPRSLERICLKALAPDRDRRYRTAADLERALRAFLNRPRLLVAGAVLLLFAAVMSAAAAVLLAPPSRSDSLVAAQPRTAGKGATTPPTQDRRSDSTGTVVPRITDFEVINFRRDGTLREIGTLGNSASEARCNDRVRVLVRFDSRVYCYLVALNPNGDVQPCHPTNLHEPPTQADEVVYPGGMNEHFGLSDGPGLQAFVVVASRTPLPSYAKWSAAIHWPWTGYDLRLLPTLHDENDLPKAGKNLYVVAAIRGALHFRVFDGDGTMVVDTDEKSLTGRSSQINVFRGELNALWPRDELTKKEKGRVTEGVASIVGETAGKHIAPEGVWRYDGHWISGASSTHRGDLVTEVASPKAFHDICQYLSSLPDIEVSQAVAFPVKPRD